MVRYERKGDYEEPLIYFDHKTVGKDTLTRAAFAQSVAQTFPRNKALQRALTDYAREQGRYEMKVTLKPSRVKKGVPKEKQLIVKVKHRITRGKNKGKMKVITLQKYLKRRKVQAALKTGLKQPYISRRKGITLKTPAQIASFRRRSKQPPALIDWKATSQKGVLVYQHG